MKFTAEHYELAKKLNSGYTKSYEVLEVTTRYYKTIEFTITGDNSNKRTRIFMKLLESYHPALDNNQFFSYETFINNPVFNGYKLNKGSIYNDVYYFRNNIFTCPHCGEEFNGFIDLVSIKKSKFYIIGFSKYARYTEHLSANHISDYEFKSRLLADVKETFNL
jgi:hypothetical protein